MKEGKLIKAAKQNYEAVINIESYICVDIPKFRNYKIKESLLKHFGKTNICACIKVDPKFISINVHNILALFSEYDAYQQLDVFTPIQIF